MDNIEKGAQGLPAHESGGGDAAEKELRIFLIGFMGTGKSYWGRQLAQKLEVPFFDLDHQIEEGEGKSIKEIFETEGEEHFRRLEKEVLHLVTESHGAFVMATGGGTPCFYNNIEYMKKSGIAIWINTPVAELHQRLSAEKEHRPLLKDMDDEQLLAFISKKCADRSIFYRQANTTVNGEGLSLEKLISKIFHI